MLFRFPNKDLDLGFVFKFYEEAPVYLESAERQKPKLEKIISFFIDTPPNCDPNRSFRLELFLGSRLSRLTELSFGFPEISDSYLGFMMLGPWAQNVGVGLKFVKHVKRLARQAGAQKLFIAVLSINPKGRPSGREGFSTTNYWRVTTISDKHVEEHRLVKEL